MEIKKSPKADLQNKRGLLLEIGLVVALLAVIVAFWYSPAEHRIEKVDMNLGPVEQELIEVTIEQQKPPEVPKRVEMNVITDILQVVTNDTNINTEIDFTDFDEDTDIVQKVMVKEEEILEEEIFLRADQMPSFMGGDLGVFRNWVQKQITYPAIAEENGIQGKVVLQFVVEKDGRLTNIEVLTSPDRALTDEAMRVLKLSPKWSPGMQRNRPVRISYTLPVEFRITN